MFKASPYLFFPLALAFIAAHYVALQFHLYWYISWFDTMMHLWGGFLVILALFMFTRVSNGRVSFSRFEIVGVLVVTMLGWEALEYSLGLTGGQPDFIADTCMDLVYGTLGGLLGYLLLKK